MKRWITGKDLLKRWEVNDRFLVNMIYDDALTPYAPEAIVEVDCIYVGGEIIVSPKFKSEITKKHINIEGVKDLFFSLIEVEDVEHDYESPETEPQRNPVQQEVQTEEQKKTLNSFTKGNGNFWNVSYEGETKPIEDVNGIYYIATLLQKPRISISCLDLYRSLSGNTPNNLMTAGTAIDEGLNIGISKQPINSPEARAEYFHRYRSLANDLSKINDLPDNERTPEHEMEAREIQKEIAGIMPNLKKRNFANTDDKKAQSNMSRRLDDAYDAIRKGGMQNLAEHLEDNIKTDDAYGLFYTGSISWDIAIK